MKMTLLAVIATGTVSTALSAAPQAGRKIARAAAPTVSTGPE
ncbi:hypothetical protein [uncultured Sphingomonas sp.]